MDDKKYKKNMILLGVVCALNVVNVILCVLKLFIK